jgi:hypothetical protein
MAMADLGLRLFLEDMASAGLGLFAASLAAFGGIFMGIYSEGSRLTQGLNDIAASSEKLTQDFQAGTITFAEYQAGMAANAVQAQDLGDQLSDLEQVAGGLSLIGGGALDLTLFGSAIGTAVTNSATLSDAMANLKIAFNLTDAQANQMQNTLINVANNSKFSLSQVADGFTMLGEKGQSAQHVMDGVGQTMVKLAEATKTDPVQAADLLASTMTTFNMKASDAEKVASGLTFAFYNGIPSISGLSSAIQDVGAKAAELNIPFDQLMTTLDLLNRSGLDASTAADSLRYFLDALVDPTSKAQKQLADLGIIVVNQTTPAFQKFQYQLDAAEKAAGGVAPQFDGTVLSLNNMFTAAQKIGTVHTDKSFFEWAVSTGILSDKLYDAHGHMKDLNGILQTVGGSMRGLSDQQKQMDLDNLFTVKGGKGANALLNNINNTDGALRTLQQDYKSFVNGDGLSKDQATQLSTFNASVQKLSTTWNDFMAKVGGPLTTILGNIANGINGVISAMNDSPTIQQFALNFFLLGAAFSVIAIVAGTLIVFFSAVGGILGAVAAFIVPVMGVALGIIALSAAIAGLVVWLNQLGVFNRIGAWLVAFGVQMQRIFGPVFAEIGADIRSAWAQAAPFVTQLGQQFALLWKAAQPLVHVLIGLGVIIAVIFSAALIGFIRGFVNGLITWFTGLVILITGVVQILRGAIQIITGIFQVLIGVIVGIFTGHWDMVFSGFHNLKNGVVSILTGLAQVAAGLFVIVVLTPYNAVKGFVQGVISFFQHLFDVLVGHSIVPDLIHAIINWFIGMPTSIMVHIIQFIFSIEAQFLSLAPKIMTALGGLGKLLLDAGTNFMKMLAQGISNGVHLVTGAVTGAATWIKNILGFHSPPAAGPLMDSDVYMPNMMKMYATGITGNLHLVKGAVTGVASALHPSQFSTPSTAALQSSYQGSGLQRVQANTTINLNMDGKAMYQVVVDRLTGQLVANGAARTLR